MNAKISYSIEVPNYLLIIPILLPYVLLAIIFYRTSMIKNADTQKLKKVVGYTTIGSILALVLYFTTYALLADAENNALTLIFQIAAYLLNIFSVAAAFRIKKKKWYQYLLLVFNMLFGQLVTLFLLVSILSITGMIEA